LVADNSFSSICQHLSTVIEQNNQQLNSIELQQKCEELKTPRYQHKVIDVIGAEQRIAA
jgi:hypothetical protein